MKTSKFIMWIAFMIFLMLNTLNAQSDFSDEIIVYIKDGIQKGANNKVEKVISSNLNSVFSKYNILQEKIISAFPEFNASDTIKISSEGEIIKLPNMSNIYKIKLGDKNLKETIISELNSLPEVLFAEPNSIANPTVVPNDQYFSNQWALQPGTKIKAPEAWNIYQGNSNNFIGIIDGGIDASHPDLTGKVTGDAGYGWGGHGIHVAGISAAKTNNTEGIAGVDWNAKLHSQRIDNADISGIYQAVVDAVNYSPNLYVLNNSWSLIPSGSYSTTVRMAFAYAYKMNRTSVCAMGNWNGSQTQYPAGFGQGIVAVGATDQADNVTNFSNTGNHIDVSAPGDYILSTYRYGNFPSNPNYHYDGGTSMASPHVAGIASLLKGYNSNLSNDDIEQIIKISTDDKGPAGWDPEYGTGRINAYKALQLLQAPYQLSQLSASGGTDYSSTNHYQQVFYGTTGLADGVYIVKRHEVQKNVSFPMHFDHNVWGRGVGTNGLSAANPNFGMGYCDVVPGTVTSTSATLRTYVYEVWNIAGQYLGYYPAAPSNVNFNYTVLGKPAPLTASMSGPTYLSGGQTGTFVVTASGGTPPYSYSWSYYIYCRDEEEVKFSANKEPILPDAPVCGYWIPISNSTNTVTKTSDGRSFQMKCVVTDAANNTVTVTKYVQGNLSKTTLPDSLLTVNDLSEMKTELLDNYPNPFNPTTQINYSIKEAGLVQLKIYDILGKEIATLVNENKEAGNYSVDFNAVELPSGVYIYQLTTSGFTQARKMILAK